MRKTNYSAFGHDGGNSTQKTYKLSNEITILQISKTKNSNICKNI